MRKLLHIFPTFGLGGQQRRLVDLINAIGPELVHDIISLSDDLEAGDLIVDPSHVRIDHVPLQKSSLVSVGNVKALRDEIQRSTPDYLCTYNWGSIEAVFAYHLSKAGGPSKKSPIKHLHFEDGFGPDESIDRQNAKRVLIRRMALRQSLTIIPSTTLERLARERWKLPVTQVKRVGNGIDLSRFNHPTRNYDLEGPVTIGTVGAFRPEKRLDRLYHSALQASQTLSLSLVLVGDGPEMTRMSALKDASTNTLSVTLPGASNEPESWYRGFDIFALSSDTEQMPISLIEAMANGLPVVATDVGDIKAMVSEPNRQYITPLGDDKSFESAIKKLASDHELRKNLGLANKAKAFKEFDRENMVAMYRTLFGLTS